MNKLYGIFALALLLCTSTVLAVDFDADVSDEDRATFDEILEPVMKVYNFLKYAASVIAVLVLLFTGISYIMSGTNSQKRESAKMMGAYTIVGLVIIWIAPIVVSYLVV